MTTEVNTLMRVRDKDGTEYLAYPVTKAANAIFDKETSGISADTVQEALEELDARTLDYSLEEQNTGRKWIDGKPIYCKTVDFGLFYPSNTGPIKIIPHNIPLDTCITIEGFLNETAAGLFAEPTWAEAGSSSAAFAMNETYFYTFYKGLVHETQYRSMATFYYTKTTDEKEEPC